MREELSFWKNKIWRILLIAELLLLLVGIVGLFGHDAVYTYDAAEMTAHYGAWSETDGGYTAAEGIAGEGYFLDSAPISLPAGVYEVTMYCATDTNMVNRCVITSDSCDYRLLQTNGSHMYAGQSSTSSIFWLYTGVDDLTVHAEYGGSGSLTVTGFAIRETNALSRMWIFCVVIGSLLVNAAYAYVRYDRRFGIPARDKNVHFGLAVILLLASVPVMTDYIWGTGDLIYHLMRIEGIKDNLLAGNFPGRISPSWQQGYGYASPIFYGETLLYIPALLRLIGFSVLTSWKMFFLLVGAANVLISYGCFKRIFRDNYIGLLCAGLYTLSVYRIYKTYLCGSVGETFGVLFLPLLLYGFFEVFTGDITDRAYRRSWIPLTIGFTGLVQSHLLSGEMAGFFTILLCLICIRRVFRRQTFMVLAKTVIATVLLSAWFLVPFADYMLSGDYVIENVSARTIQDRGLYLAHLLFTYSVSGSNVFFESSGMADSAPLNVGAPLLALVIWGGILFLHKTGRLDRTYLRFGQLMGGFALLAMVLSLSIFPWDRIQQLHPILATLVSSLQFPNRWLSDGTLFMVAVAGVIAKWMQQNDLKKWLLPYGAVMAGMVCITALYLTDDAVNGVSTLYLYNAEGMGSGYISGGEYNFYGTDTSQYTSREPQAEDNIVVTSCERGPLSMTVACSNNSDREGGLELPMVYYKGYQAYDEATGEALPMYVATNACIGIAVQPGYSGTVLVRFVSPWYWHAAEALSVLTLIALIGWELRGRRKEHGA